MVRTEKLGDAIDVHAHFFNEKVADATSIVILFHM